MHDSQTPPAELSKAKKAKKERAIAALVDFIARPDVQKKLDNVNFMLFLVHGTGDPEVVDQGGAREHATFLQSGRDLIVGWLECAHLYNDAYANIDLSSDGRWPLELVQTYFLHSVGSALAVLVHEYNVGIRRLRDIVIQIAPDKQEQILQRGLSLDEMRWLVCQVAVVYFCRPKGSPSSLAVLRGLHLGLDAESPAAEAYQVLLDLSAMSLGHPEGVDHAALPFAEDMREIGPLAAVRESFTESIPYFLARERAHYGRWQRDAVIAVMNHLVRVGQIASRPLAELQEIRRVARVACREAEYQNRLDPWVTALRPNLTTDFAGYLDASGESVMRWVTAEDRTRVRSSEAREVKARYRAMRREMRLEADRRNLELPGPLRRRKPRAPVAPRDSVTDLVVGEARKLRR